MEGKLTKVDIHKKAMIEALTKSLGVVTIACKEVGISRTLHYNWYNSDPEYKEWVDDVANVALDFVESKLHKQIEASNVIATIFYLKTKGKKRGYIEKSEVDHNISFPDLPSITIKTNGTDSK